MRSIRPCVRQASSPLGTMPIRIVYSWRQTKRWAVEHGFVPVDSHVALVDPLTPTSPNRLFSAEVQAWQVFFDVVADVRIPVQ